MAAGEAEHPAVARGIAYLLATPAARRQLGRAATTPASAFRASSICAITAIAKFFPLMGAGALPQSRQAIAARRSGSDGRHGLNAADCRVSCAGDPRRVARMPVAIGRPPATARGAATRSCTTGARGCSQIARRPGRPRWSAAASSAYRRGHRDAAWPAGPSALDRRRVRHLVWRSAVHRSSTKTGAGSQ